ncbi:MAG TPA: hypothetical protein VK968_05500, partial [Roseimicrobium sp.]|nr:hypothetical protein [Roseimicrobium sp.]
MKLTTPIFFLCAIMSALAQSPGIKQALRVQASANWAVEYKGDQGVEFYTVTRKEGETALLMFSRWPVPGNKDQIPGLIDSMAKGFMTKAKENKLKLETTHYKIEKLQGDFYSGQFVVFKTQGGLVQTMFMISDGDGIWN